MVANPILSGGLYAEMEYHVLSMRLLFATLTTDSGWLWDQSQCFRILRPAGYNRGKESPDYRWSM